MMFIAAAIISALLAAVLLGSGRAKLVRDKSVVATMNTVGFPLDKLWFLAGAEFAGAAGLVAGLFWWPIGVAAGVGVILYFAGAVGSHLRVRDYKASPPPPSCSSSLSRRWCSDWPRAVIDATPGRRLGRRIGARLPEARGPRPEARGPRPSKAKLKRKPRESR
jgi:hypothetical protein